jgi:Domain of unknown function (DU1801)
MAKNDPKTRETESSVDDFINRVTDAGQREDAHAIAQLMQAATRKPPKMWGAAIVGFDSRPIKYASGRELDWPVIAFSPRKGNTTLYIMDGFPQYEELLAKLGPHKTGKSCLYIKRLSDINLSVLKTMITQSVKSVKASRA